MKSRPSSKSLARTALSLLFTASLLAGCSSPPLASYSKEYVQNAIHNAAAQEYRIDCRARFAGDTLWIYLPVEDIFIPAKGKPQKNLELFTVDYCKANYAAKGLDDTITLEYLVKPVHEKQISNPPYQYNKEVSERISKLSKVALRVLHDTGYSQQEKVRFLCMVVADIKNGFEIKEIMYYPDLKKLSYGIMDSYEYTHRTIQDYNVAPQQIIGDRKGMHLDWKEITMREFILKQIEQRVRLKFRKPEVKQDKDIDKEIVATAIYTIRNYNFRNFDRMEFDNLLSNTKIVLTRKQVWSKQLR